MRVLTVLNPLSGGGASQRLWRELSGCLDGLGIEHETVSLLDQSLEDSLRAGLASRAIRAVLGIGGDGTHMAVINALLSLELETELPPYVPAPCGTGNDLAKSLGILPHQIEKTACLIAEGTPMRIDLGRLGERWFADAVSLGIDAAILSRRDALVSQRKGSRGYWPYFWATLGTLSQRERWHVRVRLDGEHWYEGPIKGLVVNNCPIHASEFLVTPGASLVDGFLDIAVFPVIQNYIGGYMRRCRRVPRMLRPKQPRRVARARNIVIESDRTFPWQIDGEAQAPESSLRIGIAVAKFSVLIDGSSQEELP